MATEQESSLAVAEPTDRPAERPRSFLQFSLFSLLLVTVAVAATCSLAFSVPAMVAIPLLLLFSVMLPAALTTVIIYGRGYQRTFSIGALFPFGVFLLMLPYGGLALFSYVQDSEEVFWFRVIIVGFWASSVLIGAVCMGVRRLVEKGPNSP